MKSGAVDNGNGALTGITGSSVNYSTGVISFNPNKSVSISIPNTNIINSSTTQAVVSPGWETHGTFVGNNVTTVSEQKVVTWTTESRTASFPSAGGNVSVRYRTTGADTAATAHETLTINSIDIDLTPNYDETIVYDSVRFDFAGKTYIDRNGLIYTDLNAATGEGALAGTLDYASGVATLTNWNAAQENTVALKSLLTDLAIQPVASVTFRLPASPIQQGSFQIRATQFSGTAITATADMNGIINTPNMAGYINYETGVAFIRFGQFVLAAGNESKDWYDAGSIKDGYIFKPKHVLGESIVYNAVSYSYIPLSSTILGLDPIRLPQDGRVPVYSQGDVVVVLNDQTTTGTFSNGGTLNLNRVRLAKVTVKDHAGNPIASDKYSVNLDTGIITWNNLSGVSQPITITDRIEDMAVVSDVQITGQITLSQPLSHAFPKDTTLVSNAVINGTIYARTSVPFDQQTWTNVWSDSAIGTAVSAQYNYSQYPIVVDNNSAIQERWALIFTSATLFNVIGEHVGQIVTGQSIATDCAPINPNTSQPYFTMPANGFGSGWAAGNVIRFNTYSANAPVWIIQSIAQGQETNPNFTFCIEARGDIDNVS